MTEKPKEELTCEHCKIGKLSKTLDTRKLGTHIRRRRECDHCGERSTTYEVQHLSDHPDYFRIMELVGQLARLLRGFPEAGTMRTAPASPKAAASSGAGPGRVPVRPAPHVTIVGAEPEPEPDEGKQRARDFIAGLRQKHKMGELT